MVNPLDPVMGVRRGGWFAYSRAAMLHIRTREGDAEAEAALERWLPAANDNANAYMDAAALWEDLGDVLALREAVPPQRPILSDAGRIGRASFAASWLAAPARLCASAALVLLVSLLGWQWYHAPTVYHTAIGEQRVVTLADNTKVTLNTDSELKVYRMGDTRRATLVHGEALFDVAHDADHPFVLKAGKRSVIVRGTSFVVRNDPQNFNVSLITGRVEVAYDNKVVTLRPGDRYRSAPEVRGVIDRPRLETVTAWRKGELVLDNMRVTDAVSEMNRYSSKPIILQSPGLAQQRISGVFRTGESAQFANTIASLYGASVRENAREWAVGAAAP